MFSDVRMDNDLSPTDCPSRTRQRSVRSAKQSFTEGPDDLPTVAYFKR